MSDKKLIFQKFISRDWNLIYSELGHRGYTIDFRKQFSFGYTESIYEGKDGQVAAYRSPSEHVDGLKDFVLKNLKKDKNWLSKQSKSLREKVRAIIYLVETAKKKDLSSLSNKELANLIEQIFYDHAALMPQFVFSLWFPAHIEDSPDAEKYKNEINEAIEARKESEKLNPSIEPYTRELCLEVCKRAKIDIKFSKYLSLEDILGFLRDNKKINLSKLKERSEYYIITNEGILSENILFYLKRHGWELEKPKVISSKEVRGKAAYPGKAKGKACIITNQEMFSKFKKGDIIIASMTTPDYAPLMKVASAFVTNEGGITCHAAIVARELKKPCVIGTKMATEVFKDGDLIEVDADKGIVRKL